MLMPFKIIYELFVFALQAAFVYGLGILFIIGGCIWLFSGLDYSNEVVESVSTVKDLVCLKVEGCAVNMEARSSEEYCPTCVWR